MKKNPYKIFLLLLGFLILTHAHAGVIKIINKCVSGPVLVSVTGIPDKKKWYKFKCIYASEDKKIQYNDSGTIGSKEINHTCNYRLLLNLVGVVDVKLKDNNSDNAEVTLLGDDGISCQAIVSNYSK